MKRNLAFVFALSILLIFTVSPIFAVAYYVSTIGSDSNPGTIDQP